MSAAIRFRWTLNRADHLDLLRSCARLVRFAPLFAAALLIAGVVLAVLGQWLPALFGMLLGVVILLLPYWQAEQSRRSYPLAGEEIRASADDEGVKLDIAAHAHSELHWRRISGWSDTGRTIVLRTSHTAGGYPIPRRAFEDHGQAEAFTELLHTKLGAPGTRNRRQPH